MKKIKYLQVIVFISLLFCMTGCSLNNEFSNDENYKLKELLKKTHEYQTLYKKLDGFVSITISDTKKPLSDNSMLIYVCYNYEVGQNAGCMTRVSYKFDKLKKSLNVDKIEYQNPDDLEVDTIEWAYKSSKGY